MAENRCSSTSDVVEKERAEKLLTQRPGSKADEPDKEVTFMPFEHDIGDSGPKYNTGKPDFTQRWHI